MYFNTYMFVLGCGSKVVTCFFFLTALLLDLTVLTTSCWTGVLTGLLTQLSPATLFYSSANLTVY